MSRDFTTCPREESNLRPSVPETGALSTELRGRVAQVQRVQREEMLPLGWGD